MKRRLLHTLLAALLGLAACDSRVPGPRPAGGDEAAGELRVIGLEAADRFAMARDDPLVVRFSADLDPSSLAAGTVRVVRRETGGEVAIGLRVDGDTLTLLPPEPFGFEAEQDYALVLEGFPSLLAPRGTAGAPLAEPYRAPFRTTAGYRPEVVAPRVEDLELVTTPEGAWRIRARFTEPVDPESLEVGRTFRVTDADRSEPLAGRLIAGRAGKQVRFLPGEAPGVRSVRVRLTRGITDRTGNPLYVYEKAEAVFRLPTGTEVSGLREIAEDFTTRDFLDPSGTTALWNGDRLPGALLAEPATTLLVPHDDPDAPETFLKLGGEEIRFEMILGREELGIAREITGLVWSPAGSGFVPAQYDRLEVRVVPTTRETLDGPGFETEPEESLLVRAPWRIREDEWDRVVVPFSQAWEYDGQTNLRLTIRVGAGDHTNFVRCRPSDPDRARVVSASGAEALRPILALRSFSWNPTATSRFYDTGVESPRYLPALVQPESMPEGVTRTLSFQGAHRVGAGGRAPRDDPDALSAWTEDPTAVSGYRFLRFRVVFYGVSLGGEGAVDDIVVPFRPGP